MTMKSQLSARPGRGKAKMRNLKQRASARPALGRSRRRSKPAALAIDRMRKALRRIVMCDQDGHAVDGDREHVADIANQALKD